MSGHPSREALEGFLLSLLPASEAQAVAGHLLRGCQRCQRDMAMISSILFDEEDADLEVDLSSDLEEAYDRAITLAMAKAVRTVESLHRQRDESTDQVDTLVREAISGREVTVEGPVSVGLCEALLDRSFDLRDSDLRSMLRLARCAQDVADRLDSDSYPQGLAFDLRARAWSNLANALRLNDDLESAQRAMKQASEHRMSGTGDPLLHARLSDLAASLEYSLRHFGEALRLLDVALAIHRRHSGPHEIGRILVLKGLYTGASGDAATGLQFLTQSLKLVDRARDPFLAFQALHNILYLRTELGEFEAADRQLRRMLPLYEHYATPVIRLKLLGVEGEIAAGLGELELAEARFRQARAEYEAQEMGYMAALLSLNLAIVLLRQGRSSEVREIVLSAVSAFHALGIEREARAAVQVLREAQEQDQATVEVLRLAGRILRRLQRVPSAQSVEIL